MAELSMIARGLLGSEARHNRVADLLVNVLPALTDDDPSIAMAFMWRCASYDGPDPLPGKRDVAMLTVAEARELGHFLIYATSPEE